MRVGIDRKRGGRATLSRRSMSRNAHPHPYTSKRRPDSGALPLARGASLLTARRSKTLAACAATCGTPCAVAAGAGAGVGILILVVGVGGTGIGMRRCRVSAEPRAREWRDILVKYCERMHRLVPRALAQAQSLPVLVLVSTCACPCRRGQRGPSGT